MADTGSEPRRRSLPARGDLRLTLRLRLTLLYGACFLVAGAALLGVTYAVVAHETGSKLEAFTVRTPRFEVDALANTKGPAAAVAQFGLSAKSGAGAAIKLPVVKSRPKSGGVGGDFFSEGSGTTSRPKSVAIPPGAQRQLTQTRALAQRLLTQVATRANVNLKAQQAHSLSSLLTWSGVVLGVMAILSIALGWLLAGRALRPLRTMNRRAREITEESLHERLGVDQRADELGDLAASFDELLARLERAFESQRLFVANASHELRTPITLSRTLVEVALADPDASHESLRRACERVLASTEQQERLIEALLTLARGQAGIESGESVDLAQIADDVLLSREASLEGLRLERELQPAPMLGDPALLGRLVCNLVDNAVLHNAGEDRWLRIETGQTEQQAWLRIANSGNQIPAERVQELFEPFRRLEDERTATVAGLGLGLSIVQAIANAHGAELVANALPGGGLEVELRFSAVGAGLYPDTDDGNHERVLAGTDRTG